ncbi:5'-nucleotidase C-terminal domain-containing protein [Erwinia sp. 9145]|uniref:bifunctional metallophosphatase/5'-nucleotidase n=1 Tax=Erwinia sp. 9145 TaxID=1500895 RepID=UPI000550A855|nr:5'-nucleotidase C-terminal domain-containing protein [Erwinia sp. 9145]
MHFQYRIKSIAAIALLLTLSIIIATPAAAEAEIYLVHTNDVHGHVDIEPFVKGYVDKLKSEGKQVVTLSAGDAFAGVPFASLSKGLDVARVMNAAGYEMMVLGNHEYAMEADWLSGIFDAVNFPILGANAPDTLRAALPTPGDYLIKNINGVKIAFLGLTTSPVAAGFPEKTLRVAERLHQEARRQGATVFVAVAHLGVTDADPTMRSTWLAEKAPWLTAIIDGHCHTLHKNGLMHNGVLIAEAGEYGQYLGVVKLTLRDDVVVEKTASTLSLAELRQSKTVLPDSTVRAIIDEVNARNQQQLAEVVFTTPVKLVGERHRVRSQETNLGDLVADAYRAATAADVAFAAGVTIRRDIAPGPVTRATLLSTLGSEQPLCKFTYTGAQLKEMIEYTLAAWPAVSIHFQQVSGVNVKFDPSRKSGDRIVQLTLEKGEKVRPDAVYQVATRKDMLMIQRFIAADAPLRCEAHDSVYPAFIRYVNSGITIRDGSASRLQPVSAARPSH